MSSRARHALNQGSQNTYSTRLQCSIICENIFGLFAWKRIWPPLVLNLPNPLKMNSFRMINLAPLKEGTKIVVRSFFPASLASSSKQQRRSRKDLSTSGPLNISNLQFLPEKLKNCPNQTIGEDKTRWLRQVGAQHLFAQSILWPLFAQKLNPSAHIASLVRYSTHIPA